MLLLCRPDTGKVYVLLRDGVGSNDVLRGAFHAHFLLHQLLKAELQGGSEARSPTGTADRQMLGVVRKEADRACPLFLQSCRELGWDLQHTMLNPHEPRLLAYTL